ncbi:carbohydrate ABC transporter permease [Thermogemmatispora sp.]|jgi:multiple sugar transport system permease protein|uniref:carbohydrate ABC transporter permease n=1 Tax=Thermogemmatispora sp. TaxID=1968838 RepID=UPI00257E34FF|nr:carbohydrate ABC transporter permease [Thermogemmatispora sp.]
MMVTEYNEPLLEQEPGSDQHRQRASADGLARSLLGRGWRWRRSAAEASSSSEASGERTLLSPLMLRRPLVRFCYWVVFLLLLVGTLTTLGPLYWMVSGALKSNVEIFQRPPTFWPAHPQWSNYSNAWQILQLPLYLGNSLMLAAGAVLLQLLVSATAAYALSKLRPWGRSAILFAFFATLMVPPVVYLIPQFVNISDLPLIHVSLINNWAGVWLPEAANAFNILILKSFFDTIPGELTDAARLDGASSWQVFIRIVLPLSRPALAVITIFTVIASWKDFLWPLLVLSNSNLQPLMVALYHESGLNANLPFSYLMAGLVFASLPPILLFLLFQRQIIRGVNLTGLKG